VKSKAYLLLMEQAIMILIFALAVALCLQAFAAAGEISAQTTRRDQAVQIAQSVAECLKSGMDVENIPLNADFPVEICKENSGIPGLIQAEITVYHADTPIYALTTGWQEAMQ